MGASKEMLMKIRNLRTGLAASAIAVSGVAQEAQAQTVASGDRTEQNTSYQISSENAAKINFLNNLSVEKNGNVFFIEGKSFVDISGELKHNSKSQLRKERRENKQAIREQEKINRKSGSSYETDTVTFSLLNYVAGESLSFGHYSHDDKTIVLNHINVTKENHQEVDQITQDEDALNVLMNRNDSVKDAKSADVFLKNRLQKIEKGNEPYIVANAFQHEKTHKDNDKDGVYYLQMSAEQLGKTVMNDEISAKTQELIYQREAWIKDGGNPNKINEFIGSEFSFYKDAVKSGEINPTSKKRIDRRKEQKLMINGTQTMWNKDFANLYTSQISGLVQEKISFGHITDFKENTTNYNKAKDKCFSLQMDGELVHFGKYLKNDVKLQESAALSIKESMQKSFCGVTPEMLGLLKGQKIASEKDLEKVKAEQILKLRGQGPASKIASKSDQTLQLTPEMFKSVER